MSVYNYFDKDSIINRVTVLKTEGGAKRAYLTAKPDTSSEKLHEIMCGMAEKSMQIVPSTYDGKPALEVRGFEKSKELTDLLEKKGWAKGKPIREPEIQKHHSFMEQVRKRSLLASSMAFLVGDISFVAYGHKEGSMLDKLGGIFYGLGTLSTLTFSRKDPSDIQIRDLSRKMSDYLKKEGANLPQDCSLEAIVEDKHKGNIRKLDDLLRRYPSEMMNMFFAAAGICVASAAYKEKARSVPGEAAVAWRLLKNLGKEHKAVLPEIKALKHRYIKLPEHSKEGMNVLSQAKALAAKVMPGHEIDALIAKSHNTMQKFVRTEGWADVGLGSMTVASGVVATMIKEKHPDPDAPPKHGIAKLKQKIEERPLAIAGTGYLVSTMCHAVSTALAWTSQDPARRKSVPLRAVFVVTNLLAELLLCISSKGHGHGVSSDKSVDNTVMTLAAELIAKQPRKMQPVLIQHVADFLGHPEILALNDKEVTQQLQSSVELMRKNPWALASQMHANHAVQTELQPSAPPISRLSRLASPVVQASWANKALEAKLASSRGSVSLTGV